MPTENRSSNTEMVSVPTLLAADNDRDMLEYLAEAVETQTYVCDHCGHEEPLSTFDIASDLREYMLAFPQAPASQPHPEPIAWMVGTAFWWTKEEAERDAAATGLPITGLGPMTDTGEVQRLREALKFYADRDNFAQDIGSDWDNVSGEPANVLWHESEAWFVEDGSIARAALSATPDSLQLA
ncbi:hypothetical protein D3C76_343210 [compost metagenome]